MPVALYDYSIICHKVFFLKEDISHKGINICYSDYSLSINLYLENFLFN